MFFTGQVVPESGVYSVSHEAHRLPHEVILLKDQQFPRCCKCSDEVQFEVVQTAPHLDTVRERVILYELPELEPDHDRGLGTATA